MIIPGIYELTITEVCCKDPNTLEVVCCGVRIHLPCDIRKNVLIESHRTLVGAIAIRNEIVFECYVVRI